MLFPKAIRAKVERNYEGFQRIFERHIFRGGGGGYQDFMSRLIVKMFQDGVDRFLADSLMRDEDCRHQECIDRLDIFVSLVREPTGQIEGVFLVKPVLFSGCIEVD